MILFALAFVLGAFCLQQMTVLPSLFWAVILIPLLFIYARLEDAQRFLILSRLFVLAAAAFVFGFLWAASFATIRLSDELPEAWQNKSIQVVGVVASISELTDRGERFRFDVENVLTENARVPRHISLSYYPPTAWGEQATETQDVRVSSFKAGERWQLTVRLKRPHGTQNPHGFDFEAWALAENIRATGSIKAKADNKKLREFVWRPQYLVEHVREIIQHRIVSVLADKQYSGIIQALVMGDDSRIAANDWQLFLRTGTTHLMSISGLHITMLSGLMFACVGYFWRRTPSLVLYLPARKAAVLAGMLTALAYALVAGFSVPTQRTLYMLTIFGVALWSGRQLVLSQVLSLALFIIVLLDPWSVISAGFWLSFGAVAILSFALGGRIGKTHWLKASLQSQWAVTIGMVPLLLLMFNQFSIVSPVANAIAIPLISLVVTPLALLGSFLPLDFALQFSCAVLDVCMSLLGWLNRLPDVVWQQYAPPSWTLIPALIGMLWLLLPRGTPLRGLGYFGLLPMLMVTPVRPGFAEMKVSVLDVGQGLSVVVQTATHTLLYDAGGKYSEQADAGSRIILPYLRGDGIRKLDGFVVSHDDSDHSGGLSSVLAEIPVSWLSSSLPESSVEAIKQQAIKQHTTKCTAGQGWQWDGVEFQILYPELESYDDTSLKDNNRSCVLKITSPSGSILLAGDIEQQAEQVLIAKQQSHQKSMSLKSDVLIAPHHGSKTSSSEEFIATVSPDLVVFTAGYLNRFRHPLPEIVRRYENASSKVLRSDYHGAVMLHYTAPDTDNPIQVVSWRKQHQRYWHDHYL